MTSLQTVRKDFVHADADQAKLFADPSQADEAITTVRDAIADIYLRTGKMAPGWLQDDEDKGWDDGRSTGGHLIATHPGVDPLASDTIRVCYVYKDREYESEILPAGADHEARMDDLLQRLKIPVSAILVYRGKEKIGERILKMRGA